MDPANTSEARPPEPNAPALPRPHYTVEPVAGYGAPAAETTSRLVTLLLLAFIIAILYFAKEVLLPMALGALLTFLLAIPAARLERLGLKRVWAAVVVALLAFGAIGGVAYTIGSQLLDLAQKLPQYEENLREKAISLRPKSGGAFTAVRQTFQELQQEFERPEPTTATAATAQTTGIVVQGPTARAAVTQTRWDYGATPPSPVPAAPPAPVPVRVVETERNAFDMFQSWAGPLLAQLGTAGIVIIFVLFMLIQREDLRDRVVRLAGQRRITITTQALDEAASRVSRYLLMQFIINVTYGVPVALGLWLIGLPNALLWGLLATLLRFIPYIGPWVAALMPIALALAVFNDWWHVALVIGLFLTLELISNNIMEPLLYGHSTGMTPFAVLVSAVFWTWLWGGVGLFMATPLTVCLVVIGRYVPQLHFIEVLLGDEPVLSPSERLYQRLLGMDMDDAADLTVDERKGRTLLDVYDDLVLPALAMAERDRHRGTLMGRRGDFAMAALETLVEELRNEPLLPPEPPPATPEQKDKEDRHQKEAEAAQMREATIALEAGTPLSIQEPGGAASAQPTPSAELLAGKRVLVFAARDDADELAGQMLVNLLNRAGAQARPVPYSRIGVELVEVAAAEKPDAMVVSAMPPMAVSSARLLARRLRQGLPESRLIVALWRAEGSMDRCMERLQAASPDALVTTLSDALAQIPAHPPLPPAGEVVQPAA